MFAGTEILSGSRDLLSLPEKDAVGGCWPIDSRSERIFSTKIVGPSPSNHEQALQTTPQLANTADSWHFGCPRKLRFILKLHVKGDRETALPMLMVVLKCCGVKNSSKDRALPMLSLVKKAQCGLNLSKVPSQT